MPEFKYQGVSLAGKPFQGIVYAPSLKLARHKIDTLTRSQGVSVRTVEKRIPFSYKIKQDGSRKIVRGETLAFNEGEVRSSLERMGYKVQSIRRIYLYWRPSVPENEVVIFIRLCADLLHEKFPYDQILTMVGNDVDNKTLRETIFEINKDLRMGKEGHQVYLKHEKTFGRFTAQMLSIASTSGNMAEVYDNTAKFLDRSAEFKRNVRSVLFMPLIVFFASVCAAVFYVAYIFPQIADLLLKYDIEIPPMTAATLAVSDFLNDNYIAMFAILFVPVTAGWFYFRTAKGRVTWARSVTKIPVIGKLIYRGSVEVFARVFHTLYSGSGENVEAIKIAAESCGNAFIEQRIKERVIPSMLRDGKSLSATLSAANVFPPNAVQTLKSGEESGSLRDSILRLANFYEKDAKHKMQRVVDIISLIITIFVSLLIVGITILSTEIGFVSPPAN